MRDRLGPGTTLCYCTNVHPITGIESLIDQLEQHAMPIKEALSPNGPMPIGFYLPYLARPTRNGVSELVSDFRSLLSNQPRQWERRLSTYFESSGLVPVTANAFPLEAFHEPVVKHRVYEPGWAVDERFEYTLWIARLLQQIAPMPTPRSISTLPLGWAGGGGYARDADYFEGESLSSIAEDLANIARHEGAIFTLDLEPEPGCILDTADDVIAFFDEHLPDETQRKHIGVCHDVCHAAVMFEDQRTVLRRYAEAGIRVNKVQISSALDVDVASIGVDAAIHHLKQFAEPRYLHQTGFMTGGEFELIEDLPEAIERLEAGPSAGPIPDRLRVHFHAPIYLDSIGPLGTTNNQIAEAVSAAREYHDTKHFEVETYAWGVLPEHLKRDTLAEGIADELKWVLKTCGV